MDKKAIRKAALQKRRLIAYKEEKSQIIQNNVLPILKPYKRIGIYMHTNDEVQTSMIIQKLSLTHKIYIPSCDEDEMHFHLYDPTLLYKGMFGITQSRGEVCDKLDVLVVPLVAYTKNKERLGNGKGYYDKYLAKHSLYTIGIAFDEQEVDDVCSEVHDYVLDKIITNKRIL